MHQLPRNAGAGSSRGITSSEAFGASPPHDSAVDLKFTSQILNPLVNSLLSVFFPVTCSLCQSVVEDLSLGVICQSCWRRVGPFRGILCTRCGYGFPSTNIQSARPLCGGCRRSLFLFDFARAYSPFEDPLKEIIHQFKYSSHPSLAKPLAHLLLSVYQSNPQELSADLIIPVPLHRSRERERGFNQAFELSRQFSRLTRIPLPTRLLVRTRPTKVQAGLSRRERRINLRGAFEVSRSRVLEDKTVLLIDDVFTTGATLNECAKILKEHGALRINVLTLARVIRG